MNKLLLIFISFILSQALFAQSPQRELDVDYTFYEGQFNKSTLINSAMNMAAYYDEEKLPNGTEWTSHELLVERFESLRDERFLVWSQEPEKKRRTPWFYPDDGCYARAAISMRNISHSKAPLANKVFAFGNLEVDTPNSPDGTVGWWYHVAPLVEINNVKYVLDPSIEFSRPLTLKEWLERMGTPSKIKVAICKSGTFVPKDNCDRISDGIEQYSETIVEQTFLKREWDRMVKLGREQEL